MTQAINVLSWTDTAQSDAPVATYGVDFATDVVWQFACEGSYLSQAMSPAGAIVDNSGNPTNCVATVGGIDISVFAFQRTNVPIGAGNRLFTLRGAAPGVVGVVFYASHPSREGQGAGYGGQCCDAAGGGGGTAQDAYAVSKTTVGTLASIIGVAVPVPLIGTADTYNIAAATAHIALMDSDRQVVSTNAALAEFVPSHTFRTAGKFYLETFYTMGLSSSSSFGFANASYNANVSLSAHSAMFTGYGSILVDTIRLIDFTTPQFTSQVIGFAVDLDNKQFWVRVGATGFWNNNAAGNPATNRFGVSIAGIIGAGLAPEAMLLATTENVDTNFGQLAFAGVPPGGFMAGWPR